MVNYSFKLATVAGIRIGIHYTWFIIFALITLSLSASVAADYPALTYTQSIAWAVITALLFFASIVLHELGHSLVAIARGVPVRSITLFIFGGVAQTERDADSAATEFLIAIAGPLVSLTLAAVFHLLSGLLKPVYAPAATASDWLSFINLTVALFNLLPGFPLDGGRVFRALVWGVTHNAAKGMRWAVVGGKLVAFGFILFGLLLALYGQLVNGLWLAAIGWFLLNAAESSGRNFALERLLQGVRVGEVMRHGVPQVSGGMTVAQWVDDYVLATGQRAFLVVDDGQTVGLVTLSDSRKLPRDRWPSTPVRAVMTPQRQLHQVQPSTGVAEALRIMERHSVHQVPVAQDGVIVGWIDRDNLLRIIRLRAEAEEE